MPYLSAGGLRQIVEFLQQLLTVRSARVAELMQDRSDAEERVRTLEVELAAARVAHAQNENNLVVATNLADETSGCMNWLLLLAPQDAD